jgi:hypothetical protein
MVPHEIGCTLENTTDWAKMLARQRLKAYFPDFFPRQLHILRYYLF